MNILLVYPKCSDTYWSFKYALDFTSKKAAFPPLGLITVSALLPKSWDKKLVDMNVSELLLEDILEANFVFISAMHVQKSSAIEVIERCRAYNIKTVAGGPLFTQEYENFPQVNHLVLNEAEITLPLFLNDLASGATPKHIYKTEGYADITMSPIPDFHLLSMKHYVTMGIQFSRGCPYACDFCEVTALLGHQVRVKTSHQVINELNRLYSLGWHEPVFVVDDNFIGNKKEVKDNLLPILRRWMQEHHCPFTLGTQISIDFADDDELLALMLDAGFDYAFIGIETVNEKALRDCGKVQNRNRDILQNITKIQRAGMQVSGGFIVGFDSDSSTSLSNLSRFIQQSGIVTAMVGLLNAPKNTALYHRMMAENRLLSEYSGSNTDFQSNVVPKMDQDALMAGYKGVLCAIYRCKPFYQRLRTFLRTYRHSAFHRKTRKQNNFTGLLKCFVRLGVRHRGRWEFWKFVVWTVLHRPHYLLDALTFTIYGYHFRKIYHLD